MGAFLLREDFVCFGIHVNLDGCSKSAALWRSRRKNTETCRA